MLSYEKSPRPWRGGTLRLLSSEPRDLEDAPAASEDLIELRALLRTTAGVRHGRIEHLVSHVLPQRLANIDHLIAIHVLGYEFRVEGRRGSDDWSGGLPWRTGLGMYTTDATRPWTTNVDVAIGLVARYLPQLRMDVRVGGARHGQVKRAKFDEKHPTLAGEIVPLPTEWPYGTSRYPAIAIMDTFLTALAMQKEASGGGDQEATIDGAGVQEAETRQAVGA
ncbi:hypothetical protein ACVIGB_000595 [Bradyrhizobium sp. USDA 4341]